jgi:hypothetical protein
MRKLGFTVASIILIFSACTKPKIGTPTRNPYNEPPSIKVILPTSLEAKLFKPLDQLKVKVIMTDIDLVAVASWEAINAAPVCGTNPWRGTFNPMTYDFEMEFVFTFPPFFPGEHIIRLYGVDASGNIATLDIPYKSTN